MEYFTTLILPLLFFCILIRLMMLPIRLGWKLLLNSLGGFLCLWLLNFVSGFTGIRFPINAVTVLIAGFLGIPGILLLAAIPALL